MCTDQNARHVHSNADLLPTELFDEESKGPWELQKEEKKEKFLKVYILRAPPPFFLTRSRYFNTAN